MISHGSAAAFVEMKPGRKFAAREGEELLAWTASPEDISFGLVRHEGALWCVVLVEDSEGHFRADFGITTWQVFPCPKGRRLAYLIKRWQFEFVFPKPKGGRG